MESDQTDLDVVYVLDAAGYLVSTSHGMDGIGSQPYTTIAPPEHSHAYRLRFSGGAWIQELVEQVAFSLPPAYVAARLAEYPSITDQLDMLWHAMNQNNIPRAEPFYSRILEIKQRYPKTMTEMQFGTTSF